MLAGGIGFGKYSDSKKKKIQEGDLIIVLGGDNYRIGMGGAAVSSTETGNYSSGIELNAVQRSNPEMQKRVSNAIRAVVESDNNFIKSIHDHGAGGHLNCISELVEESGGVLNVDDLPIGDKTLSAKEIIGNDVTLISKVETALGVSNINEIINISDKILIDRGDLSREITIPCVPIAVFNILKILGGWLSFDRITNKKDLSSSWAWRRGVPLHPFDVYPPQTFPAFVSIKHNKFFLSWHSFLKGFSPIPSLYDAYNKWYEYRSNSLNLFCSANIDNNLSISWSDNILESMDA